MVNAKKRQREAEGLTQQDYLLSKRPPKTKQKLNGIQSKMRSLCIVMDGFVRVVNKRKNFEVMILNTG